MNCSIRRPREVVCPDDVQCRCTKLVLYGSFGRRHLYTTTGPNSRHQFMLLDEIKGLVEPSALETHSLFRATESHGENEICWSSSSVVWSVGGVQKRKWSFAAHIQPVLAASFAWFDIRQPHMSLNLQGGASPLHGKPLSSSTFGPFALMRDAGFHNRSHADPKSTQLPDLCVCILHRDIGHIYSHGGLEFTINLPFTVEKVWPLSPVGLMLRVSRTTTHLSPLAPDPTTSLPRHYTLVTPFDEMRPVVERVSDSLLPSTTGDLAPLASHERIIHVSRDLFHNPKRTPSIVVTVSATRMRLRILRYETHENLGAFEEISTGEESAPSDETFSSQFEYLDAQI